jgi:glycosyltransferase involved in cell wall biosynthesis
MIIDVTRLVDRTLQGRLPTGVDRVGLEYIRHYGASADALVRFGGRWIFIYGADAQKLFAMLLNPPANFARKARWLVGKAYCLSWQPPSANRVLLNTGHSGLDDPSYAAFVKKFRLRGLYFLHDLIPITHPEYCRPGEAEKHHRRLITMLHSGIALVANSQDTAKHVKQFCLREKQPMPPCCVAPLAAANYGVPSPTRPMKARYFVMLGTIEPRKNHLLILKLWRELVRDLGKNTPHLIIIGQRGWECEQVVDMLERCTSIHPVVTELSHCSDAELATWLAHAQALLFPAFVEGYGLPIIEALNLGCPVIASNLSVYQEMAGNVPEYLHPLDGNGWRQGVIDYNFENSARRQAQCGRMVNFKPPTWAQHFAEVDAYLATTRHIAPQKHVVGDF